MASHTDAIKAAQDILRNWSPTLIVDGRWGKYTDSVYRKAPTAVQMGIRALLSVQGAPSPDELVASNQVAKAGSNESYISAKSKARAARGYDPAVIEAIRNAAVEVGVDFEALKRFAFIESRFNPKAKNGSSKGLMQMQPGAWTEASKIIKLKPYAQAVFDPVENARAGAAYIVSNRGTLNRLKYNGPWDMAHMYLAHQQGPSGLNNMYNAANGLPSRLSRTNMMKNPPPDRKGVTTNPVDFYRRWVDYVNRLA